MGCREDKTEPDRKKSIELICCLHGRCREGRGRGNVDGDVEQDVTGNRRTKMCEPHTKLSSFFGPPRESTVIRKPPLSCRVGPTRRPGGAHILHIIPSSSPTKRPPSLYYGVFRLPFDWPSLFLLIPSHPDQTRRSFIKPYSVPFGDRFVELEGVPFRLVFEPPSPIVQWPRRMEWEVGNDAWLLGMGRNPIVKVVH